MLWLLAAVPVAAFIVWSLVTAARRDRARQERALADERARLDQIERENAEVRAAPPLLDAPPAPSAQIFAEIDRLHDEFGTLATFQDVTAWDAQATKTAEELERFMEAMTSWIVAARQRVAEYESTTTEPAHVRSARVRGAQRSIEATSTNVDKIGELFEALMERVDMTPDNKTEQREVLRELRTAKKELQANKKEARLAMQEIRREARVANMQAGQWDRAWGYSPRVAAHKRREIRRAKEAMVAPHEDEVAAIERQIMALDRRIAWVQRFGDEGDA